MKVKIYYAGNFEFLNQPKKEEALAKFMVKEFGSYNRLISFFFPKESQSALVIAEELADENKKKRV